MHIPASVHKPHFRETSSLFVPPRIEVQELLDLGAGSTEDVNANFADMWRINRYLGGLTALTQHLYPRLRFQPEPLTLVDIGAGSADIAVNIARWAQHNQLDLNIWALDWSARNLASAACKVSPRVHLIQADALHLPFPARSVDYFISSLFLHHLAPEQIINLLTQAFETAKRGIIISDIVRGWLPIVAFKLGQPIFARSFLTRQDGVTSIRRAYTHAELSQLVADAGLSSGRVYQHFPWRMTLVAEK